MLNLLRNGMPIRGAFDGKQGAQDWAAIRPLNAAGADLFKVSSGGGVGKLHHKLMVIDEQVVIAGSFNYTGPANRLNDENVIILGDLDLDENNATDARRINAQKKIGQFAKAEIDRIISDHGAPI